MDCKEPMYINTNELSSGTPDAYLHWKEELETTTFDSKDANVVTVSDRKWETVPCVEKVWESSRPIWKRMLSILRHRPDLREKEDGFVLGKIVSYDQRLPLPSCRFDRRRLIRLSHEKY